MTAATDNRISDIIPIFVLGSARNGTTWLCNILSGHNDVVAAQHPAHWGFHESNLLKHYRYWGDLSPLDRRIRFLELYTAGDLFRLVRGDRIELDREIARLADLSGHPGHVDFYNAFFHIMDRFARQEGTSHWLTKLDPLFYLYPHELETFLSRLESRYRKVHFIAVQRDVSEVVRSYLNMEGRAEQKRTSRLRTPGFVLFETARNVVHYRQIRRLAARFGFPIVSYNTLKSETSPTIEKVCRALSLPPQSGLEELRYRPNSSVSYRKTLRDLGPGTLWSIRYILKPFIKIMWPAALLLLRSREGVRPSVPPVYYKLQKLERYPRQFHRELLANDEAALAELLFGDDISGASGNTSDEVTHAKQQ